MKKKFLSLAALAGLAFALFPTVVAPAQATLSGTPGVYIATGHDLDYHCAGEESLSCDEMKQLITHATTASTPNVLGVGAAASEDACMYQALSNVSGINVTWIDAENDPSSYASAVFADFDVIIFGSIWGGGGACDDSPPSSWVTAINTRSSDLIAYYNAGGGIIQQSNGGGDISTEWDLEYFDAVGFKAASIPQDSPRSVTAAGTSWGITDEMSNCCATHNAFLNPPAAFTALELDANGTPVTIALENVEMAADGIGGDDLEISMTLDLEPGEPIAGANTFVTGAWLMPDSAWTTTVNSTPQIVCSSIDLGNTNVYGAFSCNFPMPDNLEPGDHTVVLEGLAPDGSVLTRTANFTIDASGNLVSWSYNSDLPSDPGLPNTGLTIAIIAGETVLGMALLFAAYMAFGAKGSLRFAAMNERLAVLDRKLNRLYGSNRKKK